jgi:hypothetical protein
LDCRLPRCHGQTASPFDRRSAQIPRSGVAKQFERVSKGKGNRHRVLNTFADFYREHFGIDLPFASVRTYCQNWLASHRRNKDFDTVIVLRIPEELLVSVETYLVKHWKPPLNRTSTSGPGRPESGKDTVTFRLLPQGTFNQSSHQRRGG